MGVCELAKVGDVGERSCPLPLLLSDSRASGSGGGEKKSQTFWPGLKRLAMMWVKERTSLVDCRGNSGGFLSKKV